MCIKEWARAGGGVDEGGRTRVRHHHRCYLNIFVGDQRGGGVINVQVEESANRFVCRRAL